MDPLLIFQNPEDHIEYLTSENSEGQYFDRKEVRNHKTKDLDDAREKAYKTISAFTNARGGVLVLGIDDKGQIIGLNHLHEDEIKSIPKIINDKLVNHYARSREWVYEDKRLLLIYAPEGSSGICETTESPPKAWKRESANSLPLTSSDRERLVLERNKKFEQLTICEFDSSYINQSVLKVFKSLYLENTSANFDYEDETFLQYIGACKKENNVWMFTNAGYLFFTNNPRNYIPSAYVRFLKYESELKDFANPGTAIFDRDFDGCLPEMLRKIRSFLNESAFFKRYTYRKPDSSGIIEEFEYPLNAIEEAIVNAIIHRDYHNNQPIFCYNYRDAFVVKSPGSLKQDSYIPINFNLDEVRLFPYRRNITLVEWARIMKDERGQKYVKSLAEGTRTMLESMLAAQLPPPHYNTNGYTTVTFRNNFKEREARYYALSKQLGVEDILTIMQSGQGISSWPSL
ncbi:MAG: putative DNA binding domain-containing protein [Microscillaceae bacterium]|nr:putative DNA binding domain-containing protein [Microscillaceae bacterium]